MVKRGETRIGEHEGPELWKKSLAELSQMVFENPFTQLAPDFLRRRVSRWPKRKQGMESAWLVNHRVPKPYSNSIDGM